MNNDLAKVYKGDVAFSENVCWIEANGAQNGEWFIARREFRAEKKAPTILTVCASYYAEAYVNGTLVARFCERSYMFDIAYKAVDISDFVKEGKNTLVFIFTRSIDPKPSPIAAQISEGEKILLVSDGYFRVAKYTPISNRTDFFVGGGQKPETFDANEEDAFASAFENDFDDFIWEPAFALSNTLCTEPFEAMHQDKTEMQTSYPVFPESYVSFEHSRDADGIFVKIAPSAGKNLLCEAEISAENDFEFSVDAFGGTEAMSFDGKVISFGKKMTASAGVHRLALAGEKPNVFIKGSNITLSYWLKTEVAVNIPENPVPRFPWNDLSKPYKMAKETKEYLEVSAFDTIEGQTKVEASGECSLYEKLSERTYIKCADSVTDERLEKASAREISGEVLGVARKETVFSEGGEMVIEASNNDITFILDFGVERIGGIFFDIFAAEGTEIIFNAFEVINDKGAVFGHEHQIMKYICKEGRNEYVSHVRRGFRYLLVNVSSPNADVIISKLGLLEWRYPAEDTAKFECSDKRLNEIYKMSLDTVKVCMLDAYVDCPGYEQNIWTGDARVTALANLFTIGAFDFNARHLELISRSVEDGLRKVYRTKNPRYLAGNFLSCAAFPTYPEGTIPIWSYMWSLSVADHYAHTGDKEALLRALHGVEANLERSVKMSSERGLFAMNGAWNLIEWGNNDVCEYGEVTANNMILSYCFKEFAKIEAELGREELAKEYAAQAERIKAAVNEYCWDEERSAYIDTVRDEASYEKYLEYYAEIGKAPLSFTDYMALARVSVQTNTFAVLYDIAEGERRESALKILTDNIESGVYISGSPSFRTVGSPSEEEAPGGIVHVGSPFFMYFVLKTLFENGYSELALHSIKREWGDMLEAGVTTCTESFNSKTEWKTRSVAHAWSASPAIYLMTELLGVKPTKPGFTEFSVVPCRSDIDFAKGSVPTPYGEIHVEWRKDENGNINISCVAPPECVRVK